MSRHLPLLTTSAAKDFRACPRLYQFRHVLLARPAYEPETTRFGTLGHRGLEAWWTAALFAPADPDRWLDDALAAVSPDGDPYRVARAQALLLGYHYRWVTPAGEHHLDGHPIEVLAVEAEFDAPLVNPATGAESRTWRRGGKIDAIVRVAGRVLTVEHKTSAEDVAPGSDYWRRLTLDSQVSNYHVGARALGHEPSACLYDVLGKPALRPLLATPVEARRYRKSDGVLHATQRTEDETPEAYRARLIDHLASAPNRYYVRGEVVRLEQDEADAAYDTWGVGRQIAEAANADRWPRNPDACVRYGRTCAFFPVCTGTASLDDPGLYRRAERANEELAA